MTSVNLLQMQTAQSIVEEEGSIHCINQFSQFYQTPRSASNQFFHKIKSSSPRKYSSQAVLQHLPEAKSFEMSSNFLNLEGICDAHDAQVKLAQRMIKQMKRIKTEFRHNLREQEKLISKLKKREKILGIQSKSHEKSTNLKLSQEECNAIHKAISVYLNFSCSTSKANAADLQALISDLVEIEKRKQLSSKMYIGPLYRINECENDEKIVFPDVPRVLEYGDFHNQSRQSKNMKQDDGRQMRQNYVKRSSIEEELDHADQHYFSQKRLNIPKYQQISPQKKMSSITKCYKQLFKENLKNQEELHQSQLKSFQPQEGDHFLRRVTNQIKQSHLQDGFGVSLARRIKRSKGVTEKQSIHQKYHIQWNQMHQNPQKIDKSNELQIQDSLIVSLTLSKNTCQQNAIHERKDSDQITFFDNGSILIINNNLQNQPQKEQKSIPNENAMLNFSGRPRKVKKQSKQSKYMISQEYFPLQELKNEEEEKLNNEDTFNGQNTKQLLDSFGKIYQQFAEVTSKGIKEKKPDSFLKTSELSNPLCKYKEREFQRIEGYFDYR